MKDLIVGLAILAGVALLVYLFALSPLFVLLVAAILAAPFVGRWARRSMSEGDDRP